jgi:phosphate transport system substrate-binding protein
LIIKKGNTMKKLIAVMALLLVAALSFGFIMSETVITVKGSDTMVNMAQVWAARYMEKHPEVKIQVTGGGSGTGISALIGGSTDICNASRPMKASEREKLKQRFNSVGVEVKTALDGLSIYLNKANPVTELTLEQIKNIYTGNITNWKQVGGNDAKIIVYGRENSSGTYTYLKDNVLGGADYTSNMQSLPGTAAVVNAIAKDKNAIGYGGAGYAKDIKDAFVKKDAASQGYQPTAENIRSGKYPITRYLYIYLKSRPTGVLKEYIDWILSPEGQKIVSESGYFPIK